MKTTSIVLQFTNSGSMSGNTVSQPICLEQVLGYSPQVTWTGSPVGQISLQYSDDIGLVNGTVPITNWVTDTNSTQNTASWTGFVWDVRVSMYKWVRVSYVRSSGTGTLTGIITTKGG